MIVHATTSAVPCETPIVTSQGEKVPDLTDPLKIVKEWFVDQPEAIRHLDLGENAVENSSLVTE